MVDLYRAGMFPQQIAQIYGVSASSGGERLKKMGFERPYRRLLSIPATVDKSRLENLYHVEKLTCREIAAEFNVSVKVIGKALEFYQIPKRLPLNSGGQYLGVLRKLRIGDVAEIQYRDASQMAVLRQSAAALGIIVTVRVKGTDLIEISRVSEDENRRLSDLTSINCRHLAELYSEQCLSPTKIGLLLGFSAELIRQTLDFHQIPRRRTGSKQGGKYSRVFKLLKVAETAEVECHSKRPVINLHTIASRIGVRISLRKIAETRYKITRLN